MIMINKTIYLKSLVKTFKPKTESLPKDMIKELKLLGIDLMEAKKKPKVKNDFKAGRDFILNHTEEFMRHVVDYSLNDKIDELINDKKI